MKCPNGCDSQPFSCPITVDVDVYAESKAQEFELFKGVSQANGTVRNSNPVVELTIDQSAYSTENHFKKRDAFENMSNCTVTDDDGTVTLEFTNTNRIITAMECRECDTVYEPDLDNRIFSNPTKYTGI